MFRALFKPYGDDVTKLLKFLEENQDGDPNGPPRLAPPRRCELGSHGNKIMVELYGKDFDLTNDGLRDECWKTAEWIRHKSPLGDKLKYTVMGYEGTKIIYTSGCPICKERKDPRPHHEHVDDPIHESLEG